MEAILLITAVILLAGGIIFSVLPPLPGPILTYAGMLVTHYAGENTQFANGWLVFFGLLTVLITVLDYALPIAATKKFGGTRAGVWGGIIGTVVGVFTGIGILLGPLLGAIIGDLIGGNHFKAALKSGFGSFVGFLIATTIKVVFSLIMGLFIIWKIGVSAYYLIIGLF